MTVTTAPHDQRVGSRRFGYLVGAACNAALLYLTYVQPGWRAVPFLTEATTRVLGLFTVSLMAGLACNVLYLAYDRRWLTVLGNLLTTGISLVLLVRIWRVFPFDFTAYSADWAMVTRVVLAVAIAGTAIGVVAGFASLVRVMLPSSTAATR